MIADNGDSVLVAIGPMKTRGRPQIKSVRYGDENEGGGVTIVELR